jgi:hypothetical protein
MGSFAAVIFHAQINLNLLLFSSINPRVHCLLKQLENFSSGQKMFCFYGAQIFRTIRKKTHIKEKQRTLLVPFETGFRMKQVFISRQKEIFYRN